MVDLIKVRALNDTFRENLTQAVLTPRVAALPDDRKAKLLEAVRTYDNWEVGDEEHSIGFFTLPNEDDTWFWRLDYYAPDMQHGSADPDDTEKTVRLITIGHAVEY